MTKARDLANSAAAFSAVSATELGYVDGVTSAIQTQLDAKADSSTAVTLTGTQTLTNKTLTSPVIASVINNTLTSTTGDIIYASAANTPARLGIGSSAQVLTVASGIPSWAAAASASGPAFSAYSATNQTITGGTYTKITFGSEDFDTAGNFASNRFTPTTAGYYQMNFGGYVDASGATNFGSARYYFNGSAIRACNFTDTTNDYSPVLADVIYFNGSTDYLEVFTYINGGGTVVGNASAPRYTYFSGVWIRS